MPELLDTFDQYGNKIGTILKGEQTNDYLKCCSCFVINLQNQVLIEKRGKTVLDAGKLDLCSGHIDSGESDMEGMRRELKEELGIQASESKNLKKIGTLKVDFGYKCIISIYFLKRTNEHIKLQDSEVESVKYYSLEDAIHLIRKGKTRFPYDESFEEIFRKLKQEIGIK